MSDREQANRALGQALDEMYQEDPASRPSEAAVERAAERLGITDV